MLQDVQRRHGLPVDELPVPIAPSAPVSGNGRAQTSTTGTRGAPALAHNLAAHTGHPVPSAVDVRAGPGRPGPADRGAGSGPRRRLTVIHAPTGFGKSILAAQWGRP